ncbi:MAG: DUF11 domain-containing protein [Clostridia bacterium]|nr:DUF11 domain-containing protein [Clostridia bacterium]
MKKLISLLLALIFILSAFSGCGEKTPEPAGDPSASAPASEDIPAPDGSNDEEDTDKEATEITPPDMPAIITTDPSASAGDSGQPASQQPSGQQTAPSGAQTDPGTQTPAQSGTGTGTQTPSQTQTPSSSNTGKGLVPASGKVEFTTDWKEEYNIVFFGDGFTIAYNMGDIMKKFAEADGIKLNFSTAYYDNIGTDSTYNFYECFKWDTSDGTNKVASVSKDIFKKPLEDPANNKADIFMPLVSRDRGICIETGREKNIAATEYYTQKLTSVFPNARTVVLAPSGYKEGNDGALIKKIGLQYTGLSDHNKAIHTYADEVLAKVAGNKSAVYLCDAYDYFNANYASSGIDLYDFNKLYPSMAGGYYNACVVYAAVFGNATSGIPFYGFFDDENAAKTLQEAADKYVASTGKTLKAHGKTYSFQPLTLEQADPRNLPQKPEYAHEVYPQYYDEVLSAAMAYYQRTWFIQYDNLNMDRANKSMRRRETSFNLSPEEATPQNYMYSDCSAYLHELFVDAFNCDFDGANGVNSFFDNTDLAQTDWRVFDYCETTDKRSKDELKKEFMSVLQPGDFMGIQIPDGSGGHIMLYIGNGMVLHFTGRHATGGGENYLYDNGTDEYEMINSILYDPIEKANPFGGFTNKDYKVAIFRPWKLNIKPSTQAKNRLKDLRNVVAYKHTTAPEGVTVNPGDDVTFTFVIRNVDFTPKTINITDKISQGTSFKSGKDFKVQGSDISAAVTVPAGETVKLSYTVTVDKNATPGTTIENHSAYLNGVRHNDTPINVAKTLTAEQQKAFAAAVDKVGANASNSFDLALKAYKDAFNYTLPYSSAKEAFDKAFEGKASFAKMKTPRTVTFLNMFGGKRYTMSSANYEPERIRHISTINLVAGDLLLFADNTEGADAYVYVYLGDHILAEIADGKLVKRSSADSQMIVESSQSRSVFCVLRPSMGF